MWPDLTGRDLRIDSMRNKNFKNSEIPKLTETGLNIIRLADFCTPTDHSQMYNYI